MKKFNSNKYLKKIKFKKFWHNYSKYFYIILSCICTGILGIYFAHSLFFVSKEKEVVKNYYLEDYINTIRYILTFDEDVNNKYSVYIENKISDNDMSSLLIRIMSNKIGNVNGDLLLNKEIKGFVPSDVANEIVNEIKNHFAHNHYIVYSSVNTISKIQILQNERFAVNIKLNSEEEVEEAIAFNDNINSKDRHATRVLKMI